MKINAILYLLISVSVTHHCTVLAASINDVQQQVINAQQQNVDIQSQIDQLHVEQQQLDRQYQSLLIELEKITSDNTQLEQRISSQAQRITSFNQQLASVAQIEVQIQPLMTQMHLALAQFVAADLPFLTSQRTAALEQLNTHLADADSILADKYLALLNAYKNEAAYANDIQVYQDSIMLNNTDTQVNMFRLGRTALYYQTLDKSNSAYWSKSLNGWQVLSNRQNSLLSEAISSANGSVVPSLLALPFVDISSISESLVNQGDK
ncbi:DUF3450 domain-containing protein [Gammaproteobacteria bacterium AS21]